MWSYIAVGFICGFLGLMVASLAAAASKAEELGEKDRRIAKLEATIELLTKQPRRPDDGA